MDIEKIKVDKKEVGKLVGLGKRAYTNAKKRVLTIVVDQIEDYENELFAEDMELARLVKAKQILDKETKEQKKELDSQILERINKTLVTKRGYDAEELYDKRQEALLELLKDSKLWLEELNGQSPYSILHGLDYLSGEFDEETHNGLKYEFDDIIERLGNMIKDLEEV